MKQSVSDLSCCVTKKEKGSQLINVLNLFFQNKSRFSTKLKNVVWICSDDKPSNSGIITVAF